MCTVWYHYIPRWGSSSVVSPPPTAPPADFAEISARLQAIESTVYALSTSQDRVRVDLVSEIKSRDSLTDEIKKVFGDVGRVNTEVGQLKSQIGKIDGLVSGPMLCMACTGHVSDMLGYKISLVFIKEIRQKHEEISEKEEQVGNNFKAKTFK